MDADKWDDFPDNFVAADGARIRQASNKNGDLFDNTNVNSESNGFEVHKNWNKLKLIYYIKNRALKHFHFKASQSIEMNKISEVKLAFKLYNYGAEELFFLIFLPIFF